MSGAAHTFSQAIEQLFLTEMYLAPDDLYDRFSHIVDAAFPGGYGPMTEGKKEVLQVARQWFKVLLQHVSVERQDAIAAWNIQWS